MMRSLEVCVFSERPETAAELLSAGRELAADARLACIVTGPGGDETAHEQIRRGADKAYVIDGPNGVDVGDLHVEALARVVTKDRPDLLLIGATAHGTEIASRLAGRLGVGCASDCTRLALNDGEVEIERACLGRFIERQVIETRPAIATVQPRRFEPPAQDEKRRGQIEPLAVRVPGARTRLLETRHREKSSVRIDKADVVVGVGRGLRGKEDLPMIEELARAVGGVVGASRPLTDDLQWLSPDVKIGLSGVTVKPKLYIACGISGQIEHNVGMRESGVVVAINSDPAAPIMRQADYCVTGDLHAVVPALIEALTRR